MCGSSKEERLQAVLWEMEVPKSRVSPKAKGATDGDGVRPDGEFGVSAFGEENRCSQFGR